MVFIDRWCKANYYKMTKTIFIIVLGISTQRISTLRRKRFKLQFLVCETTKTPKQLNVNNVIEKWSLLSSRFSH